MNAGPRTCGFCPHGHHRLCPGSDCACSERDHNPDTATAASMLVYCRPDLAHEPEVDRARWWFAGRGL